MTLLFLQLYTAVAGIIVGYSDIIRYEIFVYPASRLIVIHVIWCKKDCIPTNYHHILLIIFNGIDCARQGDSCVTFVVAGVINRYNWLFFPLRAFIMSVSEERNLFAIKGWNFCERSAVMYTVQELDAELDSILLR